jgi:small-conductance mechanosensitive channel
MTVSQAERQARYRARHSRDVADVRRALRDAQRRIEELELALRDAQTSLAACRKSGQVAPAPAEPSWSPPSLELLPPEAANAARDAHLRSMSFEEVDQYWRNLADWRRRRRQSS